jgi:hypothetical protein
MEHLREFLKSILRPRAKKYQQSGYAPDKIVIYGYTFRKGTIKVTDEGFELQHGTEVILH